MSTISNDSPTEAGRKACCSPAQVVTGVLAVIGAATVLWMLLSHQQRRMLDPQAEIDRRINDLENSLSHLQDIFGQAVRP